MALQRKIIDCGATLAAFGMLLRFVVAPASMAVCSLIVGLRGDVLCIAIIQVNLKSIYIIYSTTVMRSVFSVEFFFTTKEFTCTLIARL